MLISFWRERERERAAKKEKQDEEWVNDAMPSIQASSLYVSS